MQKGASKHDYLSYKYEFPGGKVEPGESFQAALRREIEEEIRLEIKVGDKYHTVAYEYPHFSITLEAYLCTLGHIDALQLTEHIYYQWLNATDLPQLDWAPADLPVVAKLADIAPSY